MEHYVTMDATKKKMVNLISLFGYKKSYLNKLSEEELLHLGIEVGAWTGRDKDVKQRRLL